MNIYEIKPGTSIQYKLKIISEGQTKVFISFSNRQCLVSEAQSLKDNGRIRLLSIFSNFLNGKEFNVNQSAK